MRSLECLYHEVEEEEADRPDVFLLDKLEWV
jgi:hypothetical protein